MKKSPLLALALLALGCDSDPRELQRKAAQCASSGKHGAAEKYYRRALARDPEAVILRANLAFALTHQNKHAEAIAIYTQLVQEGEGAYDLFAWFATSLSATGRDDEAIAWNYRALSILPELVDVRADLAKLLVRRNRPYEALALLASYDDVCEGRGDAPYFKAKRIAMAAAIPASPSAPGRVETTARIGGHYRLLVTGSNQATLPFLVDTGASHTTMSVHDLKTIGLTIPSLAKPVVVELADRRKVTGQKFMAPELRVGPFRIKNVPIIVCEQGAPLLGQSTLEHFDLRTSRHEGVEFLSLQVRP